MSKQPQTFTSCEKSVSEAPVMLKNLTTLTNSVGFGWKLSFVAPRIPDSTSSKWEIVRDFVSKDQPRLTATPETLKTLCENIAYFEEDFFLNVMNSFKKSWIPCPVCLLLVSTRFSFLRKLIANCVDHLYV